ncbi:MAG TPA: hypothetical protein VMN60_12865 [Longimicrobiales bacterium]|nr:hypothetical protein [Longimicrobiales bacterium]
MSRFITALVLSATCAAGAGAQTLREQCSTASRTEVRTFCEQVADGAVIMQPRLGIALSGGNPVPGTASTLGMRIGSLPRVSVAVRVTAAQVELPPVERVDVTRAVTFPLGSLAADVSIGLFSGFNVLPTVGGLASVDLLGSAGMMPLPRGEGFDDSAPLTWALGARVGILRESFTAPGISLSGMYRRLDDVAYGSETLSDRDAFLRVSNYDVASFRATVGKRLLGFGVTAGAGYDRYGADIAATIRDPMVLEPNRLLQLSERGVSSSRTSVFGNLSFTLLILNLAAEAGWQQGGDPMEGATDMLEKGALFGGIAIRIAI